jgi:diguanylate cyclase (GGDEF)-like protein
MTNVRFKILLADDDAAQRKLLMKALLDCAPGLQIITADSGKALFQLLEQGPYDCLVLDCNMPPLGPLEIIGAPQVHAAGCSVVAVSSCEQQSVVIDSLRGGAVDFVPKSEAVLGTFLWECVQKAIQNKRERDLERRQTEARQQELESLAKTDLLTGLLNRRSFQEHMSQGRRHGDKPMLGYIMLDIDHFKAINDSFGHNAGDTVLSAIGKFIQSTIGPSDLAFRWGGEEFLILRPCLGLGDSYVWAESLRRKLSALPVLIEGGPLQLQVTPSIGVETVFARASDQCVIDHADQAMYLAKKAGRNQVCTWPMVAVLNALEQTSQQHGVSVAEKRNYFLARCSETLSAVQNEHVTLHCEKVAFLSAEIARVLGMPERTVENLRLAGLLHDLGKCLIPADLLEKSDPLTSDERRLIDRLPVESAKISMILGADIETAETIGREHIANDPCAIQLKKDDAVDSMTSVLRVADIFVAMTTDRAYRPRVSPQLAQEELESKRGQLFHPATLDALADVVYNNGASL